LHLVKKILVGLFANYSANFAIKPYPKPKPLCENPTQTNIDGIFQIPTHAITDILDLDLTLRKVRTCKIEGAMKVYEHAGYTQKLFRDAVCHSFYWMALNFFFYL
jgi:hypothetical protein